MPSPSSLMFIPLHHSLSFHGLLFVSGVHISELSQPPENSRCQKGDMNQIQRLGPIYIKYHGTKCCCPCELVHWDLFTVICITDDIVRQTANKLILIITTYSMSLSKIVMISGIAIFLGARGEKSQGLSLNTLWILKKLKQFI
jgi:hypothetical protein